MHVAPAASQRRHEAAARHRMASRNVEMNPVYIWGVLLAESIQSIYMYLLYSLSKAMVRYTYTS